MKNKITLLAAGIIVMLAACKKENATNTEGILTVPTSALSMSATQAVLPGNPQNPYDSVGMIHNQVLQKVCSYVNQRKDTTSGGIRKQVSAFFQQRYGTSINTQLIRADQHFLITFPARQVNVIPDKNAPANYCNQILAAINQLKEDSSYQVFYRKIVSIESNVLHDKTLTPEQAQQVLTVASIARYSIAFWMTKAASNDNDTMGFFRKIWQVINSGLADAGGAIDGIFSGSTIGESLEEASFESALCSALM